MLKKRKVLSFIFVCVLNIKRVTKERVSAIEPESTGRVVFALLNQRRFSTKMLKIRSMVRVKKSIRNCKYMCWGSNLVFFIDFLDILVLVNNTIIFRCLV